MDIELDAVHDSDYINVLQALKDVKHHATAAPLKANKGLKRKAKQVDELQQAKEALREGMHRLIASPYTKSQTEQAAIAVDASGTSALRALWTLLQQLKVTTRQGALSKDIEARFKATVQCAVTAIDPDRSFPQEVEERDEEVLPNGMLSSWYLFMLLIRAIEPSRRSGRLAVQKKVNYDEGLADDGMEELLGIEVDDDDDME